MSEFLNNDQNDQVDESTSDDTIHTRTLGGSPLPDYDKFIAAVDSKTDPDKSPLSVSVKLSKDDFDHTIFLLDKIYKIIDANTNYGKRIITASDMEMTINFARSEIDRVVQKLTTNTEYQHLASLLVIDGTGWKNPAILMDLYDKCLKKLPDVQVADMPKTFLEFIKVRGHLIVTAYERGEPISLLNLDKYYMMLLKYMSAENTNSEEAKAMIETVSDVSFVSKYSGIDELYTKLTNMVINGDLTHNQRDGEIKNVLFDVLYNKQPASLINNEAIKQKYKKEPEPEKRFFDSQANIIMVSVGVGAAIAAAAVWWLKSSGDITLKMDTPELKHDDFF